MTDMTFEALFEYVQRLTPGERLRMMELMAASLQVDFTQSTDWHESLRATYGILADDPIDRPPQLPIEEREPLE
jgi:hypothetical protein